MGQHVLTDIKGQQVRYFVRQDGNMILTVDNVIENKEQDIEIPPSQNPEVHTYHVYRISDEIIKVFNFRVPKKYPQNEYFQK